MKRFHVAMDDDLFSDFYRLWPGHGERAIITRKCIKRLVKQAKEVGGLLPADINTVADTIVEEEKERRQKDEPI